VIALSRCLTSASAAMVLVAFLWGGGFTASKAAVADVPPLAAGILRYGLALLILLPLYLRERRRIPPERYTRFTWKALVALGLTAVAGYNALYFWGLSLAPSSDSILLIPTTNPIWTTLIATLFIGERPGRRLSIGMIVAFAGMLLVLVGGYTGDFDRARLLGNGMFILAAIVFGASHVISRVVTRQISPIGATTMAGVIGTLALLPMAILEGGLPGLAAAPLAFWLNIAFVAFGVTAIGYVLFYRSVVRIGPGRTSFYTNLVPLFGLTLSAIFLAEYPTIIQLAGGAVMLGAIIWVSMERGTVTPSVPIITRAEHRS
jgi:drug/metabolite transporter (DMT)-like permease